MGYQVLPFSIKKIKSQTQYLGGKHGEEKLKITQQ